MTDGTTGQTELCKVTNHQTAGLSSTGVTSHTVEGLKPPCPRRYWQRSGSRLQVLGTSCLSENCGAIPGLWHYSCRSLLPHHDARRSAKDALRAPIGVISSPLGTALECNGAVRATVPWRGSCSRQSSAHTLHIPGQPSERLRMLFPLRNSPHCAMSNAACHAAWRMAAWTERSHVQPRRAARPAG